MKKNIDTAIIKINRSIKNHMYFILNEDEKKDFLDNLYKIPKINTFDLQQEIIYNTNESFLNYLFDILTFLNSCLILNKQHIILKDMKFIIDDF